MQEGRGQEQDMSAHSSPTASLVVLMTAREGGDVMWFDMSSNNTTFLLPKTASFQPVTCSQQSQGIAKQI